VILFALSAGCDSRGAADYASDGGGMCACVTVLQRGVKGLPLANPTLALRTCALLLAEWKRIIV